MLLKKEKIGNKNRKRTTAAGVQLGTQSNLVGSMRRYLVSAYYIFSLSVKKKVDCMVRYFIGLQTKRYTIRYSDRITTALPFH